MGWAGPHSVKAALEALTQLCVCRCVGWGEQGEGRKGWLPGGRAGRRQACAVRPRRAAAVQKGPKPKGPLGADPHSATNELEIKWEAQSSLGVTAQESWRLWENKFPEQCSSHVTSFFRACHTFDEGEPIPITLSLRCATLHGRVYNVVCVWGKRGGWGGGAEHCMISIALTC